MFHQRMIAVGIALVIVMATLGACNSKSVAVPTFEIRISLTPAAKKKLAKAGESIKGTIFFDGDGTPEDNPSSKGLQIGRILMNHIGNLQLLKKGIPIDEQDKDIKNIFLSSVILMESIKMADEVVQTAKTKYRIEPFLREA